MELALAVGSPTLPAAEGSGPACIGRAELFDDVIDGESRNRRQARHRRAAAICETCPVFSACERLAHTTIATLGGPVEGVWAGRLRR